VITKESIEILKFYLRDKDAVKKEALETIEELERRIDEAQAWLKLPNGVSPAIDTLTIPDKE